MAILVGMVYRTLAEDEPPEFPLHTWLASEVGRGFAESYDAEFDWECDWKDAYNLDIPQEIVLWDREREGTLR